MKSPELQKLFLVNAFTYQNEKIEHPLLQMTFKGENHCRVEEIMMWNISNVLNVNTILNVTSMCMYHITKKSLWMIVFWALSSFKNINILDISSVDEYVSCQHKSQW